MERQSWFGSAQLVQPLSVRLVSATTIVLLLGMVLYALLGTYTRRVHATGLLLPSAGLITVASSAAGVASSVAVREGDHVEKGALLYVINLDTNSADGATEQRVLVSLRQQKTNLTKERDLRRSTTQIEKKGLADQRANLQKQNAELAEQIAIEGQAVDLQKNKAAALQRGVSAGFVRDSEFQSQNYLYIQTLSQKAQFEQLALQNDARISDLTRQLDMFDAKLAQELNSIDRDILHVDQLISETEARRTIEVRAPEAGITTSIRVHAGQLVAAGAPLLTLLPTRGKLTVNLFVDSTAIGFIAKGAPVVLRYAAYPFQRFGLYRGKVEEVTRAPIEAAQRSPNGDEPLGGEARAGLYRILVQPQEPYVMAYGQPKALEAGMRVDADVALEKRPLYRWLFDPLYHLRRSAALVSNGGFQ